MLQEALKILGFYAWSNPTSGYFGYLTYKAVKKFQEAYKDLDYKPGSLPISEKISGEILSLPLYPEIQEEEIETVCRYIRDFFLK